MSYNQTLSRPAAPTGAYHPDLTASAVHRYREPRIELRELVQALTCSVSRHGSGEHACSVVNLSSTGVAVIADATLATQGTIDRLTLKHGERVVFAGPARVAHHHIDEHGTTLGLNFSGSRLDVGALVRFSELSAQIRGRLLLADQQRERLPLAWRAAVSDLRQLLDAIERMLSHDEPAPGERDDVQLLSLAFEAWAPRLYEQLSHLHELSKGLDTDAKPAACDYAYRMLWPALQACPMHRRAHDKPRGYAGDYRMMLLYFTEEYEGRTRYARFLHYAAQRYSLGRAVIERQQCLRAAIREAAAGERPRIVSLAAGPALELASAIAAGDVRGPIDLVLIDQDEEALAYAHTQLSKLIHERGSDIALYCIPMSVKQLLSPKSDFERAVIERHVAQASLIYCCGLYDYLPDPVAERLTAALYRQLRPSGRLYLGNLKEAPDTSWIMDYVVDWKLIYRTEPDMLRIARDLAPAPTALSVECDSSGYAIFLSARAPA